MNEKITEARNQLKEALQDAFQNAFDSNSPTVATDGADKDEDSEEANFKKEPKLNKNSSFYVDCGIEMALDDPQMNLFPMIGESQAILKAQMREQ